jgi:hypothetical protein
MRLAPCAGDEMAPQRSRAQRARARWSPPPSPLVGRRCHRGDRGRPGWVEAGRQHGRRQIMVVDNAYGQGAVWVLGSACVGWADAAYDPGSPTFWITRFEHVRDGDQVVVRVDLPLMVGARTPRREAAEAASGREPALRPSAAAARPREEPAHSAPALSLGARLQARMATGGLDLDSRRGGGRRHPSGGADGGAVAGDRPRSGPAARVRAACRVGEGFAPSSAIRSA